MISALVLHAAAQQGPLRIPVGTTSVEDLLQVASAQSGRKIVCDPKVAKEIIGLATEPVPLEAFLKQLCSAVDAQFKEIDGGYSVFRTGEDIEARVKREERTRVAVIRRLLAESSGKKTFDKAAAEALATGMSVLWKGLGSPDWAPPQQNDLAKQSPAGRLAIQFLASLPDRQLARLGHGARLVFATKPTKMQLALPSGFADLIARFKAEQALYARAVEPYKHLRPEVPLGIVASENFREFEGADRFLVVVEAERDQRWSCRIHGFDKGGQPTLSTMDSIRDVPQVRESNELAASAMVDLPTLAQNVRSAIDAVTSGRPDPVSEAVCQSIVEEKEPLDRFLRPILEALHKETGENILVVGDDLLFGPLYDLWANPKIRLRAAEAVLSQGGREVSRKEVWRTYRSHLPIKAAGNTADRKLLHDLLDQTNRDGHVSLLTYARFARKHPDADFLGIPRFFLAPLAVAGMPPTSSFYYVAMLRMFAIANPPERGSLTDLASLEMRRELERCLFGAGYPISYDMMAVKQSPLGGPDLSALRYDLLEPTNAFPDGLPPNTRMPIGFTWKTGITRWGSSGRIKVAMEATSIHPSTLAREMKSPENAYMVGGTSDSWRYAVTKDRMWTFELNLNDYAALRFNLTDRSPVSKGLIKFDDLPKDFLDAVAAERKKLEPGYRYQPPPAKSSSPPPPKSGVTDGTVLVRP